MIRGSFAMFAFGFGVGCVVSGIAFSISLYKIEVSLAQQVADAKELVDWIRVRLSSRSEE